MKSAAPRFLLAVVLLVALSLVACGSGSTTGQTTGGTPTGNSTATAHLTAKPKPTSLPAVTEAYCRSIMTLSEANQIMQPTSPYTTLSVTPVSSGGVCVYEPATPSYTDYFAIALATYTGPVPVSQQDIDNAIAQASNSDSGTQVTNDSSVSGVGDQADYLVAVGSGQGASIYIGDLFVLYGHVYFVCSSLFPSAPGAAQENTLKQCAQTVLSRL